MDKRFDVIIVGSGAGGGTLARHLAPSGKSILILERGDWLKREAENWDATAATLLDHLLRCDLRTKEGALEINIHYLVVLSLGRV